MSVAPDDPRLRVNDGTAPTPASPPTTVPLGITDPAIYRKYGLTPPPSIANNPTPEDPFNHLMRGIHAIGKFLGQQGSEFVHDPGGPKALSTAGRSSSKSPKPETPSSGASESSGASAAASPADPSAFASTPEGQMLAGLQPLISPMAMQLMFSNTIAPYLSQLGGQVADQGQQNASLMGNLLNNVQLPPEYRAVLSSQVPLEQQDTNNVSAALQGAATAGPAIDNLMSQVQQAMAAQRLAEYITEKDIAYGTTSDLTSQLAQGAASYSPAQVAAMISGTPVPASTTPATPAKQNG